MRAEVAYRALLALYPKSFRDEFGEDMVQLFRDMQRHQRRSKFATWARAIPDLIVSAIYERKEWVMSKKSSALMAGIFMTAAVYTVILIGVGGSVTRALLVFAAVSALMLALVGIAALVGRKMTAPTERASTYRHHWWVPAPMLLALGYMVIGLRPLAENPSGGDLIGLGVNLLLAALIGFGLISRYRRTDNLGNWLILVACLPPLGVFWFPPIPIVSLIGIIGSLSEVLASRRRRLGTAS